ncbi:MAG TPA: hypothetical protein VGU72_04390 [Beijerinckiaceae bacterium]|nr:hypothetical protein [Beijerinckiaceae bacterium]
MAQGQERPFEPDIEGVRAAITAAEPRRKKAARSAPVVTTIGAPRTFTIDGQSVAVEAGQWKADRYGMPPDCPVQALGMDGDILYVVDALGQLRAGEPGKIGQGWIESVFGQHQDYLYWAWPRFAKGGGIDGWRAEMVRRAFYTQAAIRGLFSAVDRVRGRGAWRGQNGELIWHSGDALWRTDKRDRKGNFEEQPTGFVSSTLYQARPAIMTPWSEPVSDKINPAGDILKLLRSWNWTRPEVDPVLMLGWIASAILGGALKWRPTVFAVGDKAVGKSTLQDLVKGILGGALLRAEDTTEAGIFQTVKQDSLPVSVDELEADVDNRKAMAVIHLARLAASGGQRFRGGSDHVASQFRAQSSFFFSSINPPPLKPQDVSRMAILRVHRRTVEQSAEKAPVVDADTWGPMLLRRLMDEWPRFDSAFDAYRTVLREAGHDGRAQDTLGTLLACADLALGAQKADELGVPMVDDINRWGEWLAPNTMLEYEEASDNWRKCVIHILTGQVEAWRGGRQHTVGDLIDWLKEQGEQSYAEDLRKVRTDLKQIGLGLLVPGEIGPGYALAVPNESPLLFKLFRETEWAGVPGASVWKSALRQGPSSVICTDPALNRVRISGVQLRCALIRLDAFEKL